MGFYQISEFKNVLDPDSLNIKLFGPEKSLLRLQLDLRVEGDVTVKDLPGYGDAQVMEFKMPAYVLECLFTTTIHFNAHDTPWELCINRKHPGLKLMVKSLPPHAVPADIKYKVSTVFRHPTRAPMTNGTLMETILEEDEKAPGPNQPLKGILDYGPAQFPKPSQFVHSGTHIVLRLWMTTGPKKENVNVARSP